MKRPQTESEAERKARFAELGKRGGKRSGEVRRARGKQGEPLTEVPVDMHAWTTARLVEVASSDRNPAAQVAALKELNHRAPADALERELREWKAWYSEARAAWQEWSAWFENFEPLLVALERIWLETHSEVEVPSPEQLAEAAEQATEAASALRARREERVQAELPSPPQPERLSLSVLVPASVVTPPEAAEPAVPELVER